jgi:hypothetical protein
MKAEVLKDTKNTPCILNDTAKESNPIPVEEDNIPNVYFPSLNFYFLSQIQACKYS